MHDLRDNCPTPKAKCKANSGDIHTAFMIAIEDRAGKYAACIFMLELMQRRGTRGNLEPLVRGFIYK